MGRIAGTAVAWLIGAAAHRQSVMLVRDSNRRRSLFCLAQARKKAWQFLVVAILALVASAARAEIIEITNDLGGLLYWYQLQWEKHALEGANVRIAGPCVSACTVLLGYIPREKICVTSNASLGFHLATMDFATQQLLKAYPSDIRSWIDEHGGLTWQVLWLQAPKIYRFFRRCEFQTSLPSTRSGPTKPKASAGLQTVSQPSPRPPGTR